jgi:hypothetical protein
MDIIAAGIDRGTELIPQSINFLFSPEFIRTVEEEEHGSL